MASVTVMVIGGSGTDPCRNAPSDCAQLSGEPAARIDASLDASLDATQLASGSSH